MKKSILLDTNFLLIPAQFKVDIFSKLKPYNIIILDTCIRELKKISQRKGKQGREAGLAIEIIKKYNPKIVKTGIPDADTAILEYAKANKCMVATNDRKLIKTLLDNKIKIIRLKQRKYI